MCPLRNNLYSHGLLNKTLSWFNKNLNKSVWKKTLHNLILTVTKVEDMARVFSVNFPYRGKSRAALVSFEGEGYDMSFLVRYLDAEIYEMLPERKIVVSLTEGIKSPRDLTESGEDLINHTAEAISQYLLVHH
jgi:hypothetical protein